jgi:single-stranded-DNA-specific exonuclease
MAKWNVKNEKLNHQNLVESIYRSRGIHDFRHLFELDERNFYDPYQLKDMQKVVDRIMDAIKKKQKILIYGDYDVDGITSTFLMYKTIKDLGGRVFYDIPNRFVDGYGLTHSKTFDIINDDFHLVITVDNGIKSVHEVDTLMSNGVDVIVTDHHESDGNLPNAYAIIHTSLSDYPFKSLAGVGVAFKVAQALIGDDALELSDLAALGTIADMMPLVDENRAIVNIGLKQVSKSTNVGIRKLAEFLNISQVSVADVQFKIAPRINACGRMKSAKLAMELLLSETEHIALKNIHEIEETNNKRKLLTKRLYDEAINQVDNDAPSIIIHSPKMHEGVLGIVASRLANEYSKVAVVLKEDEYTYKGSIRSYNGVDVIYILRKLKDILLRFGGHQNAAGLEFIKEHLDEFKTRFNELMPTATYEDIIEAEGVINIEQLPVQQIVELERFDLKDAVFIFPDIPVTRKYLIKGLHTKLVINSETEAIFFNNKSLYYKLEKEPFVSLLGRLDINSFRGNVKKQIMIDDYSFKYEK